MKDAEQRALNNLIGLLQREARHSGVWFAEHLEDAANRLSAFAASERAEPGEGVSNCPVGSCQRHGECMYRNHPRCTATPPAEPDGDAVERVDPELVARVNRVADAVGKDRHVKAASLTGYDWRRIAAALAAIPTPAALKAAVAGERAAMVRVYTLLSTLKAEMFAIPEVGEAYATEAAEIVRTLPEAGSEA